jgi:hypothetical protein
MPLKLVKTKNKVFNKSNTHVGGADLGYYANLWTVFLGISSISLVSSPGQRPGELLPSRFVRRRRRRLGGHLGWKSVSPDTTLEGGHSRTIPPKFGLN